MTPDVLGILRQEQSARLSGGLYHRTQIQLAYNSNRIEGSRLTEEQTRLIFETHTVGPSGDPVSVDDIVETTNHFRAFDDLLDQGEQPLDEPMIQGLHARLKAGTSDEQRGYAVGRYKTFRNEVGGRATTPPTEVATAMAQLIRDYEALDRVDFEDVIAFHYAFESIHPFQDGNGRVGRLIMFKECLRHRIVPFVLLDQFHKLFYYRGLHEYDQEPGFLIDTCRSAQDVYERWIDYFYAAGPHTVEPTAWPVVTGGTATAYLEDLIRRQLARGPATRADLARLIEPELPANLTAEARSRRLSGLLTKLRRSGVITNMGSRKAPRWTLS